MKTLKYALVFAFGLMLVSCSDESVRPLNGGDDDDDDPVIIIPPKPNAAIDSTGIVPMDSLPG